MKFGSHLKKVETLNKIFIMKRFYTCLLLVAVAAISCQKSKGTLNSTTESRNQAVVVKPPTANFRITNTQGTSNNVLEGKTMNFENISQNGDSYLWDFGNGTTSDKKVPTDINLWPCSSTVTVTLTVTGKDGKTATHSEPYFVICARTVGGKHADH